MWKKSENQFRVQRQKNIPQDLNLGDCGFIHFEVYWLFNGLNDDIIPVVHLKMAVEIYEEVP